MDNVPRDKPATGGSVKVTIPLLTFKTTETREKLLALIEAFKNSKCPIRIEVKGSERGGSQGDG